MKGRIKFIKKDKGFGFISSEDGKDLFFHITDFIDSKDFENLEEDDKVEFEKGLDRDMRKKAKDIKLIKNLNA